MNPLFRRLQFLPLVVTWVPASIEKIAGAEVPEWFYKQFSGSLLDLFPGALGIAFVLLTSAELLAAVASLAAFFASSRWLLRQRAEESALAISILCFCALSFGQRITHKYDSAGSLFLYAVLCVIMAKLSAPRRTTS